MSKLFCFGFGFSAEALARRLPGRWHVSGTARSAERVTELKRRGFDALVWAGLSHDADVAAALRDATHVLVSAPPQAEGDAALLHFAKDLAQADALRWVGYLSTVGVYAETGGGWVDETSPVSGDLDRAHWRLDAERDWLALGKTSGKRVQVFRLAGIYGPGRSAFDSIRAGRAQRIIKPGQVFNRIHVDDIGQTLAAAMAGRGRHDIYNVTDDEPAPPQDLVAYAAELMGVEPPPEVAFKDAVLTPMARSFYEANRRVSNARIKGDLNVRLAHPNYRDGLRAIAAGEGFARVPARSEG